MIGNFIVLVTCIAMAVYLPTDPFWAMLGFVVVKDPSVQYEALFFFYAVLMSIAITAYAFSKDAKP